MGGACAGIAAADTDDATGDSTEGAAVTSKVGGDSDGAGDATKPDPPTSTVGSGRDGIDVESADEDNKKNGFPADSKKFHGSFTVPILRIPRKDELPASGLPNPALFYTTLVIPVPTLADLFSAMQPQPAPSPAPSPAFRTQEDAPPVADSSGGGGGGVDAVSTGVAAEPPVLQAPLVIAPLPIPLPPAAPLGPSAAAPPAPQVVADTVSAGARAPVIRGSLPSTAQPPAGSLTPMSGQATRLGYPRYLRSPTTGELAAVALPGAAGLLFLTFSGGLVGYRQANSARFIRTQGADRFMR